VWCVYRLGALLYDRRTGCFAALVAAFLPAFFFRMGEYRTDVLWTTLWLASLAVALAGKMSPGRIFWAALLLGAAFMTSMKTTLLLLCVVTAAGITWQLAGRPVSRAWPRYAAAFTCGLLLVPGIIVAYFAGQGALQPLYHCVIEHNTLPGRSLPSVIARQIFSGSTLWLIPVGLLTWQMLPSARREPARGYRRLFLFLLAGLFYSILRGLWPVVTTQDYLPWMPLLPVFVIAGGAWLRDFLQTRFHKSLPWLLWPVLLLAGEITMIVAEEPPFARVEDRRIGHLAELLRLVDPGEYVFDLKGETIFRPRPCYLVLESLTIEQLKRHLLNNDINERLVATRTAVARLSERMPLKTQEFIKFNYIRIHRMRVLGQHLQPKPDIPLSFTITIPAYYRIVSPKGVVHGTLDGQPIDEACWLDAGRHELLVSQPAGQITLVWARALERGFSPYEKSEPREDSNE